MKIINDYNLIRVGIADDDPNLRMALQELLALSPRIELVFEVKNGYEAVQCVQQYRPDVLVMDIFMPELDGLDATRQIANLSVITRVILTSSYVSLSTNQQAAKAGAYGFIDKMDWFDLLLGAIETVYRGGRYFPKEFSILEGKFYETVPASPQTQAFS